MNPLVRPDLHNTGPIVVTGIDCKGVPMIKPEQTLRKVRRGTTVSVWVFGQAVGGEKTVRDVESFVKAYRESLATRGPSLINCVFG